MSIKDQLVEELSSQLEAIAEMEVGSEKWKIANDGATKLAAQIIEIEKFENDAERKDIQLLNDTEYKEQQFKDEKRDRLIRNCIEGAKVIGGFGLATWAFVASMNFEKEGTLTTEGGRTALRSLLKFIK